MRYILDIAYEGTRFAGWQYQPNAWTVQEELEKALTTLFRIPVSVTGAGRTDAGVHAYQLMVHFDHEERLEAGFVDQVNGILPMDVAVNRVFESPRADFHARFDAFSRAYQYQIVQQKNPFLRHHAMWVKRDIHWESVESATALLLQHQDFASFCKAHGNNATTYCQLMDARWEDRPWGRIFHIRANRFLRGMVRALVGTLMWVGMDKISVEALDEIIRAKDRAAAGPNAPAKGLFLSEVVYPDQEDWKLIGASSRRNSGFRKAEG